MNQRIIFLPYHGTGHINPCLPLADILEQNDCEVYFAGVEFFSQYVITQGFLFYPLKSVPFGLGFETWLNTIEKKKHVYLSTLWDRITDRLYAKREKELVKMLDDLNPDIVLIDATQSTDFIVLYNHLLARKIKVGIIHAMLPTHVIPGRPPVNSYAFPEDTKGVWSAILNMKGLRLQKSWRQKIKYLFFDDQLIIKRRIRKNHIPPEFISATPSLFNFNVRKLAEFVLAPREFDFPEFKVESYQHYLGFMGNRQTDPGYESFAVAWEKILAKKTAQRLKIVYCSFGTIESDRKHVILSFLERLEKAARELGLLLVISIKDNRILDKFTTAAVESIYIFPSVPQIQVLRDTDLFITHGGLSSIKESIDAEVPLLMYPVHSDYDPKGNATRVVYHGMGLRGDIRKDATIQIKQRITELLSNNIFKQNISGLKRINTGYRIETFLSLVDQLQPL